ncbi:sugar ABC transporter permease [Clostridium thermosuccinogenes]|jgi:putative aldouronate transport system permease protein|uniref:Sugar ABC transporter permease n=2 Tax=Clostridium thermosuccinogenes TaxID=84032 RepID=A0A2K2F5W2_9CLOT|nr:sugar ABC transporter permease [Pseudoclostridium thermosuccinogenes]PNT94175.1 sugar ABC transporter permease [Pseudoclostridium thermosuccinogenes]PNU00186.1 sugar ABC transporter permease [Pseudoclostridium thermosuccinogenes]PNU01510.1 sugar ABC transporter permease [Pseudoclostridium thermosuccinogenes]
MAERRKSMKKHHPTGGVEYYNRISQPVNILFNLIFTVIALSCIIPVLFVVIISISSNESIRQIGYSFFPKEWSISAYSYIWKMRSYIGRAFLVSIGVTTVGTLLGLFMNSTMGYVLSRRNYKLRNFFTILIFIPMLFSGGLVSSYLVNTQFLRIGNTYWALILPLCVSSFYIIVLRTFFQTTIHDSIIESAKMDGASQLLIYFKIVLPISLPGLATIGLFLSFAYWNDWFTPMLYIQSDHAHMYTLQYILVDIEQNIQNLIRNAQYMMAGESLANIPSETVRMAIVVVVVLPITMSYPFFQKYFISGLTIGSVKG